jgi:hypothetical protein
MQTTTHTAHNLVTTHNYFAKDYIQSIIAQYKYADFLYAQQLSNSVQIIDLYNDDCTICFCFSVADDTVVELYCNANSKLVAGNITCKSIKLTVSIATAMLAEHFNLTVKTTSVNNNAVFFTAV